MSETSPHALLLASAPVGLHVPILLRLPTEVRDALLGGGPVPGLAEFALTHATAADRALVAGNPAASADDLVALAARASSSEPDLAARLFANPAAPREAMLTAMPYVPDADVVPRGLSRSNALLLDTARRASVAVESEDPAIVAAALRLIDGDFLPLLPAVVLRGCLGLLWTVGREAASQALRKARPHVTGELSAPVRDALADPFAPASLGRALAFESSTPIVVDRLRSCRTPDDAVVQLHAPRDALDWGYVVDAHRHESLPDFVREALARQVGCPDELRPVPPRGGPGAALKSSRLRTSAAGGLRGRTPSLGRLDDSSAFARAREDYNSGLLTPPVILREGDPACTALGLLAAPGFPMDALAAPAAAPDAPVPSAVAALTRPVLGDNPDAWVVALNLLGDFAGTLPELLTTAVAVTD
ncbi:hypothetical protein [Yinghuangia sp. YIM S09857]|uniref:hypothetical protein n=1 Tax=Yinghuangia sp. YIM S09857 TaxID=3436929 RepID=UPI003F53A65D